MSHRHYAQGRVNPTTPAGFGNSKHKPVEPLGHNRSTNPKPSGPNQNAQADEGRDEGPRESYAPKEADPAFRKQYYPVKTNEELQQKKEKKSKRGCIIL